MPAIPQEPKEFSRDDSHAHSSPIATAMTVTPSPWRSTIRRTVRCCAPGATRIPLSRVRWPMTKARALYSPIALRKSVTTPRLTSNARGTGNADVHPGILAECVSRVRLPVTQKHLRGLGRCDQGPSRAQEGPDGLLRPGIGGKANPHTVVEQPLRAAEDAGERALRHAVDTPCPDSTLALWK